MVRLTSQAEDPLNLADNDYLVLARDPRLAEAAAVAARRHGTFGFGVALDHRLARAA